MKNYPIRIRPEIAPTSGLGNPDANSRISESAFMTRSMRSLRDGTWSLKESSLTEVRKLYEEIFKV